VVGAALQFLHLVVDELLALRIEEGWPEHRVRRVDVLPLTVRHLTIDTYMHHRSVLMLLLLMLLLLLIMMMMMMMYHCPRRRVLHIR
jgi:hypothetical protein